MTPISPHRQNDRHNYHSHHHHAPMSAGAVTIASNHRDTMNFALAFFLSIASHVGTLLMLLLLYFVLVSLFHFHIPAFTNLVVKPKDIEFVLVDNNKPEPPRNKNTKNRAEKMSRSGGQKTADKAQAVPQKAAGRPTPKPQQQHTAQPTRQQQAARPRVTPRPTPRPAPNPRPTQAPTPQAPTPTPAPTPQAPKAPSPKLPRPTQIPNAALPPTPVAAPAIKIPIPAANPSAVGSGPVVSSGGPASSRGAGSGGGPGAIGPQAIPGNLSRNTGFGNAGGGRSGGRAGGAGGTGSMNQSGSPGGGGGRPGIDAMPEPDFGPYIAELQRRIKRNWNPPTSDRSKRVVALFTVGRSGQLLGVRLKSPSGSPAADDAAMAAVRASAPFRPLPANYRGSSIDIEFIFDYDVYTGGRIR